MDLPNKTNENICLQDEILAYLDGELSSEDEFKFELHLDECEFCRNDINTQKMISKSLEMVHAQEVKKVIIPENFSKMVATKAESDVSGILQKKEISNAIYICTILILLVLVGIGTDINSLLYAFERFAEKFLVMIGFLVHFVFDLSAGILLILRYLNHHFVFSSIVSIAILSVFFIFTSLTLSRIVLRRI